MTHKKLIFLALLIAQAVVLGLLENLLPTPFAFAPTIKLGLTNIVTLISLFTLTKKETVFVITARLLLVTLLGGTVSMLLYSTIGAFLSFLAMSLMQLLGPARVTVLGVSGLGGFMHNFGQLLVAAWIAQSPAVLLTLPLLGFAGILAGSGIGLLVRILLRHLNKLSLPLKANTAWIEKKASSEPFR
ncbi:heptaprenyl diphosphate synthase subunit I [Enterococcus florum]|uniref:Heptaprenyl diphosphate synthase subunit I n=1 Tax=Enterococcus florum TaxID=2480627 RepID=A0A4V0WPP6_9ENTE|nr:Gx transporter family protein [Enterococcus florum]GCF94589.1 heptaprenyl diphosphate synthase subunit I [Enterococcus florum]